MNLSLHYHLAKSRSATRRSRAGQAARPAALLVVIAAILAGCSRPAGELSIAAAADLNFALEEIVKDFRRQQRGLTVHTAYGSSGNFYSQLVNQAPFDVFLSADAAYPRKLAEQGLAAQNSEFLYAVGRIVLWAPAASPIDVEHLKMASLKHPSVRHVAIANPEHAPYGRAAEAALRSFAVYQDVRSKLVFGENVAQALHYVDSAAAEIGIVAMSLALAPTVRNRGRFWEIPLDRYPRLEQGGIILRWAKDKAAAWKFRSFLMAPSGRTILKRFGFYLPEQ